jgi:VanZ family protein
LPAERSAVSRWTPPVVWAGVIFLASTRWFSGEHTGAVVLGFLARLLPDADVRTLEAIHAGLRKLGHFAEYLILGVLIVRALAADGRWRPHRAILALSLAVAYAATDELHQAFVPGRTAAVGDVLIDAGGALAGQLALAVRHRRR